MAKFNKLPHVYIPDQYPEVTIVGDSIQLTLQDMSAEQVSMCMHSVRVCALACVHRTHFSNMLQFVGVCLNVRYTRACCIDCVRE